MTILSESTNPNDIFIILIGFAIIGAFMALVGIICDSSFFGTVGCVLFIICGIGAAIHRNNDPQIEYKALIDDTYTVKELYESYEIVGREGKMYILKAKEVKENDTND